MKTTIWILFFFLTLSKSVFGQNQIEIEGKIFDKLTKEPVPYASIYNRNSKKGTISNTDGYFRIFIGNITDTIIITSVGYKKQTYKFDEEKKYYYIFLEEDILILNEVTITPKDNSYLYNTIQTSKESISNVERKSKAYYELKSFVNDRQIELVEAYYNINIEGYSLMNLDIKAGRIALRNYRNHFFVSLASSRAILMLNMLGKNNYFPKNPIELSKSKLKKYYYLNLESTYLNNDNDSVYIIEYTPKDTTGLFFYGKIWINKTNNHFIKFTMNCDNALKHPFLPLFPSDKISNVSLFITQSFKNKSDGQVLYNHTDFIYKIDYVSRSESLEAQNYSILTKAVLYAYNYDSIFNLPFFNFGDINMDDYRKINAMPYNDFFWKNNDEYRLNDSINSNELFFNDSSSLTNKTLFNSNTILNKSFFEHPYIHWSKNRVKFRDILQDTSFENELTAIKSEQYNLSVKIYMDINSYKDSTDIITSTIFDPFESFYYLPIDNQTHCFVNIYFDLCEIERRKFEEKLKAQKININSAKEMYNTFLTQFEINKKVYLKAVERGTNKKEMEKYNNIVYKELGINNIELFQPFQDEK
ncbi:MAG: carboxypeptidase-like regulatory domain-containing protein [Saprospiraceae bacterium]|jgi:hypothetical protein|nr:carboxypeptidase-like regulatory domain-containing protein [Saprospiraceae bacterium]